jgi:thiamine kinase-like enzyme
VVPAGARWQRDWWVRTTSDDAIIGHGDPAPWNIVTRAGRPVALLDWEFAGPVDRMQEVAHAAWLNAQLYADDVTAPPTPDRLRRLRRFVDGYGLDAAEREAFVDRLIEVAVLSAANEADDGKVTPETKAGPIWGITWRVRSAAWMIRKRRLLEDALS